MPLRPEALIKGKRHGLQGPIGDTFLSKFLAVYGEGSRDLAIAELDAIRNPPGRLVVHGDFTMKPVAKVTAEDVASANLILFGTASSNPIIQRLAHALPQPLLRSNAVFIYPSPENPAHYVVIWPTPLLSVRGLAPVASLMMPVNLLPDYVEVRDGKIASAGHFDSDWRLSK